MTFSLLSVDKPKLAREEHPDYRAQYYKYTLRKTDSLSALLYNTAKTLSQIPLVLDPDPDKATQKNGEIDIKFSIEQNYALELKPTILSVGVDVKGSYDDANAQILKVMFTVKNKFSASRHLDIAYLAMTDENSTLSLALAAFE